MIERIRNFDVLGWIVRQPRYPFYVVSFLIQVILSGFFIDHFDGGVFLTEAENILVNGYTIYGNDTMDSAFNYFPMAYLTILPGLVIYHFSGLDFIDSQYLTRVFLKLPIVVGNLSLAGIYALYYFSSKKKEPVLPEEEVSPVMEEKTIQDEKREFRGSFPKIKEMRGEIVDLYRSPISLAEFFILFNPILLFSGIFKGQFDIWSGVFLFLAWISYRRGEYGRVGIYCGIAMFIKQYNILFSWLLLVALLKERKIKEMGIVIINVLIIAAINFAAGFILAPETFLYHAIIFHIERAPTGYSVTAFVTYGIVFVRTVFLPVAVSSNLIVILSLLSSVVSLVLLLYFVYFKIIKEPYLSNFMILKRILEAHVLFFIFAKVLYLQYLTIFATFAPEYQYARAKVLPKRFVSWMFIITPLLVTVRIAHFVPQTVRITIGPYWLSTIFLLFMLAHFALLGLFAVTKTQIFPRNRYYVVYVLALVTSLLNFAVQSYLATLPYGEPLTLEFISLFLRYLLAPF